VVRRVALPDAMFAIDGLLETFATILLELKVFQEVVAAERQRTEPFLATTTVLMEAVKRGAGREAAHAAIKEHALAAAQAIRQGQEPGLLQRLAQDQRIGIDETGLREALRADERFVGAALLQVDAFVAAVDAVVGRIPEARDFRPGTIL
jgi:adenylosuccinate lyase